MMNSQLCSTTYRYRMCAFLKVPVH